MAEERIDIVVSQKGATEVKRDLEELGSSARSSSPAVEQLKSAIAAVSSMADRLKEAMGGASKPVRDLKAILEQLNGVASSLAGNGFTAAFTGITASTGEFTAAAVRALGGVQALGDGFIMLAGNASRALAPVAGLGTALVSMTGGFATAATGSGSAAVAVLGASTALSTMTVYIAELSRRIIALGHLLVALRDRFASMQAAIGSSTQMLTGFGASARSITPAVQGPTQALLTFQGAAQSTGSTLGGFFASAFAKLQGVWGSFTAGVRNAWQAMTGFGGGVGGTIPPLNNFASGAAAAGGAAGAAGAAAHGASLSFFSLWRVLLALSIIREITRAVFDAVDAWTLMGNKIRQLATDSANLRDNQEAVYRAAQSTRSGMGEIATLYTRTSQATKQLGLSQSEVMKLTEEVAMAMKLSGASVQEGASAMRQLSQAFNKGKLDGDEFKSILENAPRLTKAFADGLGVTTGKLMEMSKAGELTLPKLIEALQKSGSAIRSEFGRALPTIAEGFTYVGNSITRFLGNLNEATGASQTFYNAMKFIGDNLGYLGVAIAAVGAMLLVAFGPAAITALATFGVALATSTGGLTLITGLLAGLIAYVYAFGDSWKVTADGVTVLDYIRAALQITGEYVGVVARYIGSVFGLAWDAVSSVWSTVATWFSDRFGGVSVSAKDVAGTIVGVWIGAYNAIIEAFSALPAAIGALFKMAMNAAVEAVQSGMSGIVGALNSVLEKVGMTPIKSPDLSGWKSEVDSAALSVGTKVSGAFNDGMRQGRELTEGAVSGVNQAVTRLGERAKEISEERRRLEAAAAPKGLPTTRGPNTYKAMKDDADGASGAADKLQNKLNSLLRTIDPITGAQERLRQGTETLNRAYEAGLITMERRDELLKRLKEHLRDQLDPLGKINRDMEKEAKLLRLGNDEREVQKKLLEDIEKLRKAGVSLSPLEQASLEQNIRSLEQLKEQSKLLGDVLTRVFKGAEDAFVQFIETGKVDFKKLISSMISDIARLAFQSFVTKPLQGVLQSFLGNFLPGAGGGGGFGNLFSSIGSGFSNIFSGIGFATGGDFTVGGGGGVDSQLVAFRASPGERVSVSRPGQEGGNGGGSTQIVFNISTPDVQSFKASEAQLAARMARIAGRGNRNL